MCLIYVRVRSTWRRETVGSLTIFFIWTWKGISYDIFLFDIVKISELIHEINLCVEIIIDNTIKLKIHIKSGHFKIFLLRYEHFRVFLELRFGIINKLSINKNLIFVDILNLFLFILLLCFNNICSDFVLSIRIDMRIKDNKWIDVLYIVRYVS